MKDVLFQLVAEHREGETEVIDHDISLTMLLRPINSVCTELGLLYFYAYLDSSVLAEKKW